MTMAKHAAAGPGALVHLWFAGVDDPQAGPALLEVLDDEERAQAGRFRFERDRARFVARRAFRRRVLAQYLEVEPAGVRFRTSKRGRPEIDACNEVTFSASHSDGLAVVAVACGPRVGVDIERVRPIPDAQELADRHFSPREADHVRSIDDGSDAGAFLTLWTRKESYVKALGEGLAMPLESFEVLATDEAGVVRPRHPQGGLPFVLASFGDLPGYVGAVAVSGSDLVVLRMPATAVVP
jgi:4'-phosphopantetheinyl transferase